MVFNHTTLEHVYNVNTAFASLCKMSKDVVIIIVPFVQQFHGALDYNDYWRFTPEAVQRMYADNGIEMRYCSANGGDHASIYLFTIGYRDKNWDDCIPERFDLEFDSQRRGGPAKFHSSIGANVISDSLLHRILFWKRRKERDERKQAKP